MAKLVHNVQKKQHRERSQVSSRSRLGLLEKHKDYVKRAQDYHKKQKSIKVLKDKVKSRNDDEYYHGMHTAKKDSKTNLLIANRYGDQDESLSMDQVKLLKTQDSNYIRTLRQSEISKIDKSSKHLIFNNVNSNNHKVFVDDKAALVNFKPEEFFNTTTSLLNRKDNRLTKDQLLDANYSNNKNTSDIQASLMKKKLKNFKNVKNHIAREKELNEIEYRMNTQREIMKSGSKKKIINEKTGKVTFKWKKERKR